MNSSYFSSKSKVSSSENFLMTNHMDNITQAINEISLEDEEEGGIVLGRSEDMKMQSNLL